MSRLNRLLRSRSRRTLRREFGDDMAQLFTDQRRAARTRREVAALCFAAAGDVLVKRRPNGCSTVPDGPCPRGCSCDAIHSDFRHGFRLLRRYPATSLLAIATLALGIGANTAIFSVVDAVLFRALPYPEPDRLVMVWEKRPAEGVLTNVVSPADFLDWQRRRSRSSTSPRSRKPRSRSTAGRATAHRHRRVTARFFDVLGVTAAQGRTFQERRRGVSGRDGWP